MNIADHVRSGAASTPDAAALRFEGRTFTYAQLEADVSRLAGALAAAGVGQGDRVALFLPNIPAFVLVYLATVKIGAVAVSLNALLRSEELRYFLEDSDARVLFTTEALYGEVAPLAKQLAGLVHVIIAEGDVAGHASLDRFMADQADDREPLDVPPETPAAILYTSGTTGRQKGATLTHGNVVSNYRAAGAAVGSRPGDRHLLFLPLFHCFGQNFIMNAALASGGTLVLQRRWDPEATLRLVHDEGVTHFYAVPTVYVALLSAGTRPEELGSVRYFFSAAATLPADIERRWEERFGLPVWEGYGLTETSPFAAYNHASRHRAGSIGSPIPGVEMRIVDDHDRALEPGQWGEICIRGPNVMQGYWNRPDETANALRGGWFHSGDIGYRDEDGYFFIVDRVKDMINAAGFKVWPREVEEVLYRHPDIRECAVVGVPDPLKSEVVTAYIVPRAGHTIDEHEIEIYCREHMAAYKIPRAIRLVRDLPRSATGKVLKRVLRDQG